MASVSDMLPGFKLFTTIIAIALLIVVAMVVYDLGFKKPDDLTPYQRQAKEWVVNDAAADIEAFAAEHDLMGYQVAYFPGDTPNQEVTVAIRDALAKLKDQGLVLKEDPITEELKDALLRAIGDESDDELVVAAAQHARRYVLETDGVDFLVYGQVELRRKENWGQVALTVGVQAAAEDVGFSETYVRTATPDIQPPESETATEGDNVLATVGDVAWRVLVWLLAAFLMPLMSSPLTTVMLRRRSNAVNAIALAFVTVCGVGLAWVLMEFATGGWPMAVLVVACLAAGVWNLRVLTVLEKRA